MHRFLCVLVCWLSFSSKNVLKIILRLFEEFVSNQFFLLHTTTAAVWEPSFLGGLRHELRYCFGHCCLFISDRQNQKFTQSYSVYFAVIKVIGSSCTIGTQISLQTFNYNIFDNIQFLNLSFVLAYFLGANLPCDGE